MDFSISRRINQKLTALNQTYAKRKMRQSAHENYKVVSSTLTLDPIRFRNKAGLAPINIGMMVGPLDLVNFTWALEGAIKTSLNQVIKVNLVCPARIANEVINSLHRLKVEWVHINFEVHTDESIILNYPKLSNTIARIPILRRNWYKQQVLKYLISYKEEFATLIIDSDLLLFSERAWIDISESQVAYILDDFNPQYNSIIKRMFKFNPANFDFVTHCAIFNPKILSHMTRDNMPKFLNDWVSKGYRKFHGSPICEYQTYSQYLAHNFPEKIYLAIQSQPIISSSRIHPSSNYETIRREFIDFDAICIGNKEKFSKP